MMVLHGSPRKNGNSDTLTEYFIKGVCARTGHSFSDTNVTWVLENPLPVINMVEKYKAVFG